MKEGRTEINSGLLKSIFIILCPVLYNLKKQIKKNYNGVNRLFDEVTLAG